MTICRQGINLVPKRISEPSGSMDDRYKMIDEFIAVAVIPRDENTSTGPMVATIFRLSKPIIT